MRDPSWEQIEGWWADLFGCPRSLLWQGLSVERHVGLADYEGIFVASRTTGCHISLPGWVDDSLRESLSQERVPALEDPAFWTRLPATEHLTVLGPSLHGYTDFDPGGDAEVEEVHLDDLAGFRDLVGPDDWDEGGFADDPLQLFVLRDISGGVLAASNLSEFLGRPADVGVVVHPAHRGEGLGLRVARAATSSAVRHGGIARWRARIDNAPSRKVAAGLGFVPYCHQLAIRPQRVAGFQDGRDAS